MQVGLSLYDWYSAGGGLPPRSLHRGDESNVPNVNPAIARQMWAYSDAQISYPERLVMGFLAEAPGNWPGKKDSTSASIPTVARTLNGPNI